jgi:hypothetical protein
MRDPGPTSRCVRRMLKTGRRCGDAVVSTWSTADSSAKSVPPDLPKSFTAATGWTILRV